MRAPIYILLSALFALITIALIRPAPADEPAPSPPSVQDLLDRQCVAIPTAEKHIIDSGGGPFIALTPEQLSFMRGISVVLPNTPEGIPPGEKAVMSKYPDGSAAVVFLDDDLACVPIRLKPAGVKALMQEGENYVLHLRHKF